MWRIKPIKTVLLGKLGLRVNLFQDKERKVGELCIAGRRSTLNCIFCFIKSLKIIIHILDVLLQGSPYMVYTKGISSAVHNWSIIRI